MSVSFFYLGVLFFCVVRKNKYILGCMVLRESLFINAFLLKQPITTLHYPFFPGFLKRAQGKKNVKSAETKNVLSSFKSGLCCCRVC